MSGRIVVIHPNGDKTEEPYMDREPELETMQGHVKGYIEQLPTLVKYGEQLCIAFVNDDGIAHELPFNPYATRLNRSNLRILGNMVIIVPDPVQPKFPKNNNPNPKIHNQEKK